MRRILNTVLIIIFIIAVMPGVIGRAQAGTAVYPAAAQIVISETAAGALKTTVPEWQWLAGDMEGSIQGTIIRTTGNYLDIVLPAGVTFDCLPDVEVTSGDLEIGYYKITDDDSTLRISIKNESSIASTITISNLSYRVLNQPFIGDITASGGNPAAYFAVGGSTFRVNGADIPVMAPAYIKNDRIYLAVRDIGTGLGIDPVNVLWDEAGQMVTMSKGDRTVQLTIGSTFIYINGVAVEMDVAPEVGPAGRAMLPAVYIAQAFGSVASWDGLYQTVILK